MKERESSERKGHRSGDDSVFVETKSNGMFGAMDHVRALTTGGSRQIGTAAVAAEMALKYQDWKKESREIQRDIKAGRLPPDAMRQGQSAYYKDQAVTFRDLALRQGGFQVRVAHTHASACAHTQTAQRQRRS